MANTLLIIDGKAQATVFYLALHNVKTKSHQSKLSKSFNLDISLFEIHNDQENTPTPKISLADKMKSYFKTSITSGKFIVKDSFAFKNLRTI